MSQSRFRFRFLFLFLSLFLFRSAFAVAHAGALDAAEQRVIELRRAGQAPIAVFDLDDTLFDTRDRTLRILRELAESREFRAAHPAESRGILSLGIGQVAYAIEDTLRAAGVVDRAAVESASVYWKARFFSSEWARADAEVPGAATYVRRLLRDGARIVYLTGRGRAAMGEGTIAALRLRRFPVPGEDARVELLMKEDPARTDEDFKREAFASILARGPVAAAFENEPRNANLFRASFPGATVVFVDTIHSSLPDRPDASIPWIRDFRDDGCYEEGEDSEWLSSHRSGSAPWSAGSSGWRSPRSRSS